MGQGGPEQLGVTQNALGDLDGVAALPVDAAAQAALGPGIDHRLGVDVLGQGDAQGPQLPGQGGEEGVQLRLVTGRPSCRSAPGARGCKVP